MSDNESESGDKNEKEGVYVGGRNEIKERHGQGKNIFPNGDIYEGQYVSGKRHGQGTYIWKAGHRYQGSFVSGKRHGQGVYVFTDGSVYQGEWNDDSKHGLGTIHALNLGTYSYANGNGKKKGVWVRGALSGPGEIVHLDHKVSGVFINDFEMEMPAQLYFQKPGYAKLVSNPLFLGLRAPVAIGE